MNTTGDNPPENCLGQGVTDDQLQRAVVASGYPLEVLVAQKLRSHGLYVEQERSYRDPNEGTFRTLDLAAQKAMWTADTQTSVRPDLLLLIECKKSELPYVFFGVERGPLRSRDFPLMRGLPLDRNYVALRTEDLPSNAATHMPLTRCFDLEQHPFFADATLCTTLSKAARKGGSELELSGSEPYNATVLPLCKALLDFRVPVDQRAPVFDLFLVLGVVVLRAPMIAVDAAGQLTATPWLRLVRQHATETPNQREQRRLAVDFVHASYLDTYLTRYVLPFAEAFSALSLKHHALVSTGNGYFAGSKNETTSIEARIRAAK
jgi:hypothetical protein